MKFYLATALYCLSLTTANAFSAVAPNAAKSAPSLDPVDKTLSDLPKEAAATFDPTAGDNAALQRNNKNEVWVPQVRTYKDILCMNTTQRTHFLTPTFSHFLIHALAARSSPSQPQITRHARNGPRKHCNTLQLHLPTFHSRRRFQPTHS